MDVMNVRNIPLSPCINPVPPFFGSGLFFGFVFPLIAVLYVFFSHYTFAYINISSKKRSLISRAGCKGELETQKMNSKPER